MNRPFINDSQAIWGRAMSEFCALKSKLALSPKRTSRIVSLPKMLRVIVSASFDVTSKTKKPRSCFKEPWWSQQGVLKCKRFKLYDDSALFEKFNWIIHNGKTVDIWCIGKLHLCKSSISKCNAGKYVTSWFKRRLQIVKWNRLKTLAQIAIHQISLIVLKSIRFIMEFCEILLSKAN